MGPLNTSSRAPKTKRAGWEGFWREHFCRTWQEDLCHFTHQFASCLFLFPAMENPPTSAAELDSDPDSPHLDQFSLGQQQSPLGLHECITHCTTICAILTIDDLEKRKACRSRSCSWLLTGARQRLAVDVFPRGGGGGGGGGRFRGVADFVHGKMDGMHVWSTASSSTFEAFPRTRAFVFTLPWLFCILESQVFNFFSSDRHFSSDKFSFGSSCPFYFVFHLCLLSLSVLSS